MLMVVAFLDVVFIASLARGAAPPPAAVAASFTLCFPAAARDYFNDVMSITKRYFTSPFSMRS